MTHALCSECAQDHFLSDLIKNQGELEDDGTNLECSECGQTDNPAISVKTLGELMEPVLRQNFELGQEVKRFSNADDDRGWWEREGDTLSEVLGWVLGQDLSFEDELLEAIQDAEGCNPFDGDESFWSDVESYVEAEPTGTDLEVLWEAAQHELRQLRRFFSPTARQLFDTVFADFDQLEAPAASKDPVTYELPAATELYRARTIERTDYGTASDNPMKHVGPPPAEHARAGRMNAEGVRVFYGAMEADTCLAELRPSISSIHAVIKVRTTHALRVLDFTRVDDHPELTRRDHSILTHP